jgi:photosystem II stability/assembly factor-like uncharacterized protein
MQRGRIANDRKSKMPGIMMLPAITLVLVAGSFNVPGEEKAPASWTNVTGNVGGEKWGYAGVTLLAAVPGSDDIIAGVSESGLWSTSDAGKTWKKLGAGDAAHVDGLGIDLTDPDRKTLLIGHHEQDRSIEKSTDGGQTWQKIGDKLPEHTNFSNDVIVFDSKTFVVNAAGWKQENGAQLPFGIYRTEDAGATWTKVSETGPSGPACKTSDGAIYWQTLWAAGLVKSVDQGKTWEKLPGDIKSNPVEIADGKLVAPIEKQLYVSADAGKTWQKLGPELPFKPSGIVYAAKSKAIYAWRSTEAKEDNVIARWEIP